MRCVIGISVCVVLFLCVSGVQSRWDVYPVHKIHHGHLRTTGDADPELMGINAYREHWAKHVMPGLLPEPDMLWQNPALVIARLPFNGKPMPLGLENEPTGGVSDANTDVNMMSTLPTPRYPFREQNEDSIMMNLANSNPAPDRRFHYGPATYSRPEDGSNTGDLVPPEDEWTSGEVRDGLLLTVQPVRLPDREPQDVGTNPWDFMSSSIATSLDPVFSADVGPEGVSPDAPPQVAPTAVSRMVKSAQHRMGNLYGPDYTIHGRETFSYDPTIPSNKIIPHVDLPELDLSPHLKAASNAANKGIDFNKGYTSDEWELHVLHLNHADTGAEEDPDELKMA